MSIKISGNTFLKTSSDIKVNSVSINDGNEKITGTTFENYIDFLSNLDGSIKTSPITSTLATKTSGYTLTSMDEICVCNSATPFTITLPTATGSGRIYNIKNINTGAVTVDGNSSDTIDGQTTQTLNQWDAVHIADYAANSWVVI